MAGHFILKSITQSDLVTASAKVGINWSGVAHAAGVPNGGGGVFAGWTAGSRQSLSDALGGVAIGNRNNLPPHRYLQINAYPGLVAATQTYVRGAGWADNLVRPTSAGLGLTALNAAAVMAWNAGNKADALYQQCLAGGISVEVYYIAGYEMA